MKHLLQEKLLLTLEQWLQWHDPTVTLNYPLSRLTLTKISGQRLNAWGIVYRCGIAFGLANNSNLPVIEVACQLAQILSQEMEISPKQPSLEFTVRVINPGWLDFYLEERGLALWLDKLPQLLPTLKLNKDQKQVSLFALEYAHGRCHSLLNLGNSQGLIKINSHQEWLEPLPIPWLDTNGNLRLRDLAEQKLIEQLITTAHADSNWVKSATHLSESMLDFHRYCRIWGEVKETNLPLAQGRLGLLWLVQLFLKYLLDNKPL
ncbi:MAG: hypothetical protein WA865_12410 [Spirulinaceae cyanobacterium]